MYVPSSLRSQGGWLFTQTRKAPVFQISSRFPFDIRAPGFDLTCYISPAAGCFLVAVSSGFLEIFWLFNKLWHNGYLKLIRSVSKSCFGSSENGMFSACEEQCCSSLLFPSRLHLEQWPVVLSNSSTAAKAGTQSCTGWGQGRHQSHSFGAEMGVVRLAHHPPSAHGKRSSDGESNLCAPVSFTKPQSASEAYFCMLIKWNCLSEKCQCQHSMPTCIQTFIAKKRVHNLFYSSNCCS